MRSIATALVRHYQKDNKLAGDKFLKKEFSKLENLCEEITISIKRDRVKSNVKEMDLVRDESVRNLGNLLTGYISIPIAEKQAAALVLKEIFDKYGREILTESYDNKSTFIRCMLLDFADKTAQENIAKLDGMPETIAALDAAHKAFTAAEDSYADNLSAYKKGKNATELKAPIVAIINEKLAQYFGALAEEDEYKNFAETLESEIKKINRAVNLRTKK